MTRVSTCLCLMPLTAQEPLHTEVKVTFERLGVRMLRRVEEVQQPVATYKISTGQKPPLSSIESEKGCVSCFFASIMLYGLIAEGIISADISISGKMEGVQVKDVTPKGRNYSNILVIRVDGEEGCGGEDRRGKTERKKLEESTADGFRLSQCLSFSLHRSSRPLVTSNGSSSPSTQVPGIKHDVHFSAFVPAIHYLHSINFVYELELFVKDITSATTSFRNAAVGVAKGLVGQQSKLTKGLSRLHSSFGHVSTKSASRTDSIVDGEGGEEETDTDMPVELRGSRFFFNVSIQSPVIVLPRSLTSEECLVAHLGEIKAWNDYIIGSSPTMESEIEIVTPESPSFTVCGPASMERVAVSVSNISLHATRTRESRRELEASGGDRAKLDDCCKVLKEMSLSLQIDRHLSLRAGGQGEEGVEDKSGSASPFVDSADVVITGVVCDPVLVSLPKEVFNQIMTTLQHGIRKKPRKSSNVSGSCDIATADECKLVTKTVRFHPEVLQKSELPAYMKVPKIFASFSLPKLSLELKHLIDSQDRDLVYVSLDDLSAQFHQYDANYLSLDLTLKSVLIEDLLQPEDSEYRNILTSSSKPLVFPLSPASSTGSVVRNISSSSIVPSSFPRAFFPISHLMSTPKPPIPHYVSQLFSPLRSFNTSSNSNESSSSHDQDETRTAIGQEEKATEADSHTDLLTIKAVYVGKKHRFYTEKFDSVSSHFLCNHITHTYIHSYILQHTYLHAYMHTYYTHTYLHTSTHTYLHSYTHTYLHSYTHTYYTHTYLHTYTHTYYTHTLIHTTLIHSYILHSYTHTYYTHTLIHTTHIHSYIPTHIHSYIPTLIHSYILHTYIPTHIHSYILHTYTHTYYTHTYLHTSTHTYLHSYTHTYYTHTYLHTYIPTHIHAYILHTYIPTHIHSYIPTLIHSYILHTYIHTLIHTTHIHTYILHTYTHTYYTHTLIHTTHIH